LAQEGGDTKCVSKEKYQDIQNWEDAPAVVVAADAVPHFAVSFPLKKNKNALQPIGTS
jgi:hypothetical protein